jgi:pimeloyl-ACP methyl ester carboxylesterase
MGRSAGVLGCACRGFLTRSGRGDICCPTLPPPVAAVAPGLRGDAPSEVPSNRSYGLGALVADAVALHDASGGDERAVPIGHDSGATIAYRAAAFAPDRWARLVTLAVAPAETMGQVLLGYEQLKRLFYLCLFQTPFAEMAVGANDLAVLEYLWRDGSPGHERR